MVDRPLEQTLIEQIRRLNDEQQKQVLSFIQNIDRPAHQSIPGSELVKRAKAINFDPDDLVEIARAIEEDCERIDWDEW